MTKSTTQGADLKKVDDTTSTLNNNLIRYAVAPTTGKYLVRYYFSIQHISRLGIDGKIDTYLYISETRKYEFKITANSALCNSNIWHEVVSEGILDLNCNNRIEVKCYTISFGELDSYLLYNVYDANLILIRLQ